MRTITQITRKRKPTVGITPAQPEHRAIFSQLNAQTGTKKGQPQSTVIFREPDRRHIEFRLADSSGPQGGRAFVEIKGSIALTANRIETAEDRRRSVFVAVTEFPYV